MNRIVLIGNGFDLAHGLKTSYKDFIDWYLNEKKDTSGILYKSLIRHYDLYVTYMTEKQIEECMREFCTFLENIRKRIGTIGWVDVEEEYYALLLQLAFHKSPKSKMLNPKILNIQMDHLKDMLIEYLKMEEQKKVEVIQSVKEKIYRPIKRNEITVEDFNSSDKHNSEDVTLENIMLLNFNYTKTEKLYIDSDSEVQVNHIHGGLDNDNSIIFGYGDELDGEYEKLKNLHDSECLRNIKSIRYLDADNYRNLLTFITSGPFQVCIMGHSCGNSDRTLLNTLFEHKNCVSIKPYYYKKDNGTDNYQELVQNINRCFTDMKLMRAKVVNKEFCETLV